MKKIFTILILMLFLNACSTVAKKQNAIKMSEGRETPSYFSHGETEGGFKVTSTFKDQSADGILLIRKRDDGTFRLRLLGNIAAIKFADAVLAEDAMTFDYILPDFNSNIIKGRLEKFAQLLLINPGPPEKGKEKADGLFEIYRPAPNGISKYFYQYDNAYPHAMHNGSMSFEYSDYRPYMDTAIPYSITVRDTLADVNIELNLLSIK